MAKKDARNNVISVRLDDTSIQILDLLVESGLLQSRSEAAAQLIAVGIQSADDLLQQARKLADNVKRIRQEMLDAVKSKDISKITDLLDRHETEANAPTVSEDTPLLMSVYYGAKDITDLLLSRQANLNLFEAAAVGKTTRVRDLLAENPDLLDAYSHDGWTALHLAAFFGHPETVEFLLDQGADWLLLSRNGMDNTPLHAALAARRRDTALLLLDKHGSNVNLPAGGNWTPLHLASANGDLEIAELLVRRGADLAARNADRHTPLGEAIEHGHAEVAEMLRSHGATE